MNCNSVFILSSYSSSSSYVRSILFSLLNFFFLFFNTIFKTSCMLLSWCRLYFYVLVYSLFGSFICVLFFSFSIPSSAFTIFAACFSMYPPFAFLILLHRVLIFQRQRFNLKHTQYNNFSVIHKMRHRRERNPTKVKMFDRNVLSMRQKTFHKTIYERVSPKRKRRQLQLRFSQPQWILRD